MARKTVDVSFIRNHVNGFLADSTVDSSARQAMMTILEDVLFETGNYHGFSYLTKNQVPEGQLPGIYPEGKTMEEKFENTDTTRVCYG